MRQLKAFFIVGIFVISSSAVAGQAKVLKVSGNKAVLQFPSDVKVVTGQSINLNESGELELDESSTKAHGSGKAGKRDYSIAASLSYQSNTATTKVTGSSTTSKTGNTIIGFSTEFGFNLRQFELGPTIEYASTTSTPDTGGSTKVSSYLLGVFGEFNLMQNEASQELVPGIRLDVATGSSSVNVTTASGTSVETKGSTTQYSLGAFCKYFLLASNIALRGDLKYRDTTTKTTPSTSTITTEVDTAGMIFSAGLEMYF